MLKNVMTNLTGLIGTSVFSFLFNIVLPWKMGFDYYGQYILLILVPMTAYHFLNFGLPATLTYHLRRNDINISTCIKIIVIQLVAMILVVSLFKSTFPLQVTLPVICISVVAIAIHNYTISILHGLYDIKSGSVTTVIPNLFMLVYILIPIDNTVQELFKAYVGVHAISTLYAFTRIRMNNEHWGRSDLRTINYQYGVLIYVTNLLAFAMFRTNIFFLSFHVSSADIGKYNFYYSLIDKLTLPSKSLATVVYSKYAKKISTPYMFYNALALAVLAFTITTALSAVFLVSFALFAGFFSESETIPYTLILLLVGAFMFAAFTKPLSSMISASGMPIHNTIGSLLTLATNAGACWLLIPQIGLIGAGISILLAYSLNSICRLGSIVILSSKSPGALSRGAHRSLMKILSFIKKRTSFIG